MVNRLKTTLPYFSTRRLLGLLHFSVASRTNDGLIDDDTGVLLDETIVWTYEFLNGK
jgi:hypothetical protein